MDCFKCPICNRKSVDPINLRCDHHPCFQCASQIIRIDQQSTMETRYSLACPLCHKKTITYDLRHLIINATEQDEDLFVTTKFINKKPQVMAKKCNNYVECDKQARQSKRNSMHGIMMSSNKPINLECKKHAGCLLHYYCDDCNTKNQHNTFLCSQCVKTHQKHKIFNIRNIQDKIQMINQKKRKQLIPTRKKIIEDAIYFLSNRKQSIQLQYENLLHSIQQQFKLMHLSLEQQSQQIKKDIQSFYRKQNDQLYQSISFAQKIHESFKNLQKISNYPRTQIETQVNFSICISDLQLAFETGKSKFNDKYQLPILVRKIANMPHQKIFELQIPRYKQQGSKAATPSHNNSKQISFNFDGKCPKGPQPEKQNLNMSLLKQNFCPTSPKNQFSVRLNA